MKNGVFYIALLFSLNLHGQNYLQIDTILIKEVEIRGQTTGQDHPGFKVIRLDSSVIRNYSQNTLADLISENSAIYIKSYGSGGLATASLRGTGAGHTQIAWNSINLDNPMIGQFDMSLVPAGFIDDINIFYGGGSMYISNGGFGGVIDLETKPEWDELNQIYLNPGIGSFGRYSGLIKLKAGKSGFQSVTKAFLSNAENDFDYLNTVSGMAPYEETRENNQVSQKGFIQELYYKNSERSYSARLWYQSASRNLPVPIITPSMTPPENQEDESLRTMVTYESSGEISAISITGAFISDKLEYNNEAASINSRNNSKRILLKSDFETRINGMMKIGFAFNNEVSIVNTNNYSEEKIRNVASFDAAAQADLNSWLAARLLIREILQDRTLLSPDFSACAEIKPFRGKYYLIKTSFSKNSKIPTLNDMYWSPGGNPDLKNENGYTSEITMELTNILSNSFRIRNDLTLFRNHINNMIQWRPGEFSYWEADNLNNIVTTGMETSIDANYSISGFSTRFYAGYTFTRAVNDNSDVNNAGSAAKQLVYIPVNQINVLVRLSWRNLYSTFNSSFTGKRYLNADNTSYLPEYSICDLNLGFRFDKGNTSYDACFFIENLFNASYQNIAYYPMPGRNYLLSIIFQFKK